MQRILVQVPPFPPTRAPVALVHILLSGLAKYPLPAVKIQNSDFYRTQVFLGSGLWVSVSLFMSLHTRTL